mgnify:CR=1 FL=1
MSKELELIKIDDNKSEQESKKEVLEDEYDILDVLDTEYYPPHYHTEKDAKKFILIEGG